MRTGRLCASHQQQGASCLLPWLPSSKSSFSPNKAHLVMAPSANLLDRACRCDSQEMLALRCASVAVSDVGLPGQAQICDLLATVLGGQPEVINAHQSRTRQKADRSSPEPS